MIYLIIYIFVALFLVTPYLIWDNLINIDKKIRSSLSLQKWIIVIDDSDPPVAAAPFPFSDQDAAVGDQAEASGIPGYDIGIGRQGYWSS